MAPRWIFVIAFALVLYGNGAAFVESFVNYSSWHLIGSDEFVAYHQFISPRQQNGHPASCMVVG